MNSALQITYIIISILILILVLSQKAKDNGFTTMTANNSGREVGKTFEKKLQVWTTWLVVFYIILSISFTFIDSIGEEQEKDVFVGEDVYNTEVVTDEIATTTDADTQVEVQE